MRVLPDGETEYHGPLCGRPLIGVRDTTLYATELAELVRPVSSPAVMQLAACRYRSISG
jgi:hypothetical protein